MYKQRDMCLSAVLFLLIACLALLACASCFITFFCLQNFKMAENLSLSEEEEAQRVPETPAEKL